MNATVRSVARLAALACAVLLLLGQLPLAAGASAASSASDLVFFLFSRKCFDEHFAKGDFFNVPCLKVTISKLLGYGIIAGACVVQVPQILAVLKARSARVSRISTYLGLVGYVLQTVYHLYNGSPFSAYGETVIVGVQSVIMMLLLWRFDFPGAVHVGAVVAGLAAVTQGSIMVGADPTQRVHLQSGVTLLFICARAMQIVENLLQGHTGDLAFMTLFMQFAGAAARVFTSSVELKGKPEVFWSFATSAALNGILVLQYVLYKYAGKSKAQAPAQAKDQAKTADKPQAKAKAEAESTEVESTETEAADASTEQQAPPSSGKARQRRAAK